MNETTATPAAGYGLPEIKLRILEIFDCLPEEGRTAVWREAVRLADETLREEFLARARLLSPEKREELAMLVEAMVKENHEAEERGHGRLIIVGERAEAGGESEVERLFGEWRKARAAWQAETLDARGITFDDLTAEDEGRFEDLVAAACDAQDAVIAAPSVTARDVLLKVASLTESTLEPNDPMHAVIAEAARFAGIDWTA